MRRNPRTQHSSISVVHVHNLTKEAQRELESRLDFNEDRGRVHQIPQDRIEIRDSDKEIRINGIIANVESYQIIVPGKVVGTRFKDGGTEKVVLQEGDTFNLDDAIRISIAKHVGKKFYNLKGIENLATRLSYLKCIDAMIEKLHKKYKRDAEAKEKEAQEEANRKAIIKRRRQKAIEKRRRRNQRQASCSCEHYEPDDLPNDDSVCSEASHDTTSDDSCTGTSRYQGYGHDSDACSTQDTSSSEATTSRSAPNQRAGHLNIRTEKHSPDKGSHRRRSW